MVKSAKYLNSKQKQLPSVQVFRMKTCSDRLPSDGKQNHRSMHMTGCASGGFPMFTEKHY